MISFLREKYSDTDIFNVLEPHVESWFRKKFGSFTEAQRYAVMEIHKRKNTLISSPTGSGKTLSAFLAIINELVTLSEKNELEDRVYCLYISPLKALNRDIEKNLFGPLSEIEALFHERGRKDVQKIRVGVRTGDTEPYERAKQLKKTPHIFITTPESLAIMLNSPKMLEKLTKTQYVVIDEIHSLAENKRGTHLSLSLERLQYNTPHEITRVGLSATISPIQEVAKFLAGAGRECLIADVQYQKQLEVTVKSPVGDFIYTPYEAVNKKLYSLLDDLIQKHKTTLVFTNTRSGTERVIHNLKETFPDHYNDSNIGAHHSSLSKQVRHGVEEKLKEGEMKVVVSSTSLELGIDIGNIDLVVLLTSPKSVSRALQRIGRAGHSLHEKSKGILVVMDRDDLVECVVMAHAARKKLLDKIHIPKNCLDVMAQQLIGMSLERKWGVGEALEVIRKAYPYEGVSREDFENTLKYLGGEYVPLQERSIYAKLWYDREANTIGRRGRLMRMIYYTNLGTIPDETNVKVVVRKDKQLVGSLDEEFLQRLKPDDLFVLGGKMYRFCYARGMKAYVDQSHAVQPTIPSWFSEQLPLSYDLAMQINDFRKQVNDALETKTKAQVLKVFEDELQLDEQAASALYSYFQEQKKFLGIPTGKRVMVESFQNHEGKSFLLFHTLFGRRVNDALSRYFAYMLTEQKRMNIGITLNDNGFMLQVPSNRSVSLLELKQLIDLKNVRRDLEKSLESSELLKRKFRHVAGRAFLILRRYKGLEKSAGRQQVSAQILLKAVREISPDFPVLKETYREILEDYMDLDHAFKFLKEIKEGESHFVMADKRSTPSPFAHSLVVQGYSDVMMIKDKRELLKYLHQSVLKQIGEPQEPI